MNLWEYNSYKKDYKGYIVLFKVQCKIRAKERELQEIIEKFKRRQAMTVSELITKLQAFSPDAQVNFTPDDERIFKREVFPIDEVFEIKGKSEFAGVYLA